MDEESHEETTTTTGTPYLLHLGADGMFYISTGPDDGVPGGSGVQILNSGSLLSGAISLAGSVGAIKKPNIIRATGAGGTISSIVPLIPPLPPIPTIPPELTSVTHSIPTPIVSSSVAGAGETAAAALGVGAGANGNVLSVNSLESLGIQILEQQHQETGPETSEFLETDDGEEGPIVLYLNEDGTIATTPGTGSGDEPSIEPRSSPSESYVIVQVDQNGIPVDPDSIAAEAGVGPMSNGHHQVVQMTDFLHNHTHRGESSSTPTQSKRSTKISVSSTTPQPQQQPQAPVPETSTQNQAQNQPKPKPFRYILPDPSEDDHQSSTDEVSTLFVRNLNYISGWATAFGGAAAASAAHVTVPEPVIKSQLKSLQVLHPTLPHEPNSTLILHRETEVLNQPELAKEMNIPIPAPETEVRNSPSPKKSSRSKPAHEQPKKSLTPPKKRKKLEPEEPEPEESKSKIISLTSDSPSPTRTTAKQIQTQTPQVQLIPSNSEVTLEPQQQHQEQPVKIPTIIEVTFLESNSKSKPPPPLLKSKPKSEYVFTKSPSKSLSNRGRKKSTVPIQAPSRKSTRLSNSPRKK